MKLDASHAAYEALNHAAQHAPTSGVGGGQSPAPVLPPENWQDIGKHLDPTSFKSLLRTNRHIHASLLGQLLEKQAEGTANLVAFRRVLLNTKNLDFLPATRILTTLAQRTLAIEAQQDAKAATLLFLQEASIRKQANSGSTHASHPEFHEMVDTMSEVAANYEKSHHVGPDPYGHPQQPLLTKVVAGPIGDLIRTGRPVDTVMAENNIKHPALQYLLEFESANGPAGERVDAREISWRNALVEYGIEDGSAAADHLESIGDFRLWDHM